MFFETDPRLSKLTWHDRTKKFGTTKRDWLNEETWYKGAYSKVYATIKMTHDTEKEIFYYEVNARSETNDCLLKDTWIFNNRPAFKDEEEQLEYYDYLKALLQLSLFDIRLNVDNIYLVGPAGFVNCKGDIEKPPLELYYFKHKAGKVNVNYQRYIKFFTMIDKLLDVEEIIEKCYAENEKLVTSIPFYNASRLLPVGCGKFPLISQIRHRKYGPLTVEVDKLEGERKEKTSLYAPDKYTNKNFYLNETRRTFLYKAMLDYYLIHGEENTLEHFTFNGIVKKIHINPKVDEGYYIEVQANEIQPNISDDEKKTLKDTMVGGLKEGAHYSTIEKAMTKYECYVEKEVDGKIIVDPAYEKGKVVRRPPVQITKNQDPYFGYKASWKRYKDYLATLKNTPKPVAEKPMVTKVVEPIVEVTNTLVEVVTEVVKTPIQMFESLIEFGKRTLLTSWRCYSELDPDVISLKEDIARWEKKLTELSCKEIGLCFS